jgi:hypothetical protein
MMPAIPVSTEKDIQAACIQWLNFIPGVVVWRQNTGVMISEYTSKRTHQTKKRFTRFGEVGQGDITGMARGIRLEAEIKKPGKEPTEDQLQWMAMINAHDGIAFWCDSLSECCKRLREAFIQRGWNWNPSWEIR